jgi:hypothetical protein
MASLPLFDNPSVNKKPRVDATDDASPSNLPGPEQEVANVPVLNPPGLLLYIASLVCLFLCL